MKGAATALKAGSTSPNETQKPCLQTSFYETDPLERPQCKGPMRVIALIEDPQVIRRMLEHLGQWAPQVTRRSPPLDASAWSVHASLALTYHRVPDIA